MRFIGGMVGEGRLAAVIARVGRAVLFRRVDVAAATIASVAVGSGVVARALRRVRRALGRGGLGVAAATVPRVPVVGGILVGILCAGVVRAVGIDMVAPCIVDDAQYHERQRECHTEKCDKHRCHQHDGRAAPRRLGVLQVLRDVGLLLLQLELLVCGLFVELLGRKGHGRSSRKLGIDDSTILL